MPVILSHKKKFIFIHNPKVAGSSMYKVLCPFDSKPRNQSGLLSRVLSKAGMFDHWHSRRLASITAHPNIEQVRRVLPPRQFYGYFKFGFVRNPLDRLQSLYQYDLKKDDLAGKWAKEMGSFPAFIEGMVLRKKFNKHMPQHIFYYSKNGTTPMDFIGKFENLEEDFHTVLKALHLPQTKLPMTNTTDKKPIELSEKHERMVRELYAEDYEIFGYN